MDKSPAQKIYEFGEFRLDPRHKMLYRRDDEIPLVPKAVETLLALVDRRGEIVGKDELLEIVGPDAVVEEANLYLYLSILRKTLGKHKNGRPYIETLRRRGYRFNGEVHLIETSSDGHYAGVLDDPNKAESEIRTQSGRIYLLKDWDRNKPESTTGARLGSASPAL